MNSSQYATGRNAVITLSGARILFGAIFLFDGMLKWVLLQQGLLVGVVQGSVTGYGADFVSNNALAFGVTVGVGETLAGIALLVGLFQKPAALAAAGIMTFIWAYGGFGGWGMPGYTDPGGDLMLALIFGVLVFAPTAYGLASRFRLRERLAGPGWGRKFLRFLVA
ncbi:MAG: DoxX family membrane protein [Thermoplasmata archaeon]|nr:DoxX family membrane protein [Thermoplasmata archaeon]